MFFIRAACVPAGWRFGGETVFCSKNFKQSKLKKKTHPAVKNCSLAHCCAALRSHSAARKHREGLKQNSLEYRTYGQKVTSLHGPAVTDLTGVLGGHHISHPYSGAVQSRRETAFARPGLRGSSALRAEKNRRQAKTKKWKTSTNKKQNK